MSDEELRTAVSDELYWDAKVDQHAVSVTATAGTVTLRGTVGTLAEKSQARRDARGVAGVVRVDDELTVVPMTVQARDDADLRGAVLKALSLNSHIPDSIDAHADGGWITLTGTASWQYQRLEAEHIIEHIAGVVGFNDDVELVPDGPSVADVSQAIRDALQRNARIDADRISVESSSGTVTLSGTVRSWAEHDDAITGAWNARGVVDVIDDLTVTS